MFLEIYWAKEGVIIKVKIKGYLLNKNDNIKEEINTTSIKENQIYKYINNNTKYILDLTNPNRITMIRENDEMLHKMIFSSESENTEYYIKEIRQSMNITIEDTKIQLQDNKIEINYKIKETDNEYTYIMEMGE